MHHRVIRDRESCPTSMVAILDLMPLFGVGFHDASEAKEAPTLLVPNYRGLPLTTPEHAFTISLHYGAGIPTLFIVGT